MLRVWAVARNTIRQAIRMKVAVTFIVLLLILLPVMGLTATGDGTLKGRLQTFISYGMSLASLLLCLLTIIVSIYTITSDIEHQQIYTVVTKPIRRYQILLGKLLGVITLDAMLLALFAGIVYAVTLFMPTLLGSSRSEIQQARNEFYTARASLVPPVVDVSHEVQAIYAKLERDDQLNIAYPNLSREEILKQLTIRQRLERQVAGPAEAVMWEFHDVHPADPNQSLFIRYKYDIGVTPSDEEICGRWQIGDLRQMRAGKKMETPIWATDQKASVKAFHEFQVPASAVAKDGYLAVGFFNDPSLNQATVIFPLEDGLEVLYKAGGFEGNFLRACALILCRLVFLACLGTLAGSFLSFPVAILLCLAIFLTGTVSGFVLESFDYLGRSIGMIYTYSMKVLVQLLPQFDKCNPTSFLVPARLLSWWFLGQIVLVMVGIKALVLLVMGLLIFSLRELAKVVI